MRDWWSCVVLSQGFLRLRRHFCTSLGFSHSDLLQPAPTPQYQMGFLQARTCLPEENGDGKTQACEPEPKPAKLKICLKNGLHLALTELLSFSLDLTSVSESCVCFKRQVFFCIDNTVQKLSACCNRRIKI